MFITKVGHVLKKTLTIHKMKKRGIEIRSLHASVKADYGNNVRIGEKTHVDDDVSIGDYSYVNKNSSLENCVIGKFCSISSGVYINPYEHNYSMITTHPIIREQDETKRKKVIIGNDVWIGLNAIIKSGVRIGDGAVIGAGSVVTKDVEPYEIVGGVPAKHIKWRFDEEKRLELEKIKWWDWNPNEILRYEDK